jgi:hypothetical protein
MRDFFSDSKLMDFILEGIGFIRSGEAGMTLLFLFLLSPMFLGALFVGIPVMAVEWLFRLVRQLFGL